MNIVDDILFERANLSVYLTAHCSSTQLIYYTWKPSIELFQNYTKHFKITKTPIKPQHIHGGSIKSKPNCLCHIYLMPDHIILKLSRYLENTINNMIPIHRSILFNR